MKIFFAALVFLTVFVCAVLCAKTRIIIEYKNGSLKVTLRNLFFRYTFDQSKKSGGRKKKHGKSDDVSDAQSGFDSGKGADSSGENDDNSENTDNSGNIDKNDNSDKNGKDNKDNNSDKNKNGGNPAKYTDSSSAENAEDEGDTAEGLFERLRQIKNSYRLYKNIADAFAISLRGRIELSEIQISIVYGTGNAAHTGMLCGAFWSMVGGLYAFLCRFFSVEFPKLNIQPDFNRKRLETEFGGIIAVRPAHIIIAAYKAYKVYKSETGRGIFDIIKEQRNKNQGAGQ